MLCRNRQKKVFRLVLFLLLPRRLQEVSSSASQAERRVQGGRFMVRQLDNNTDDDAIVCVLVDRVVSDLRVTRAPEALFLACCQQFVRDLMSRASQSRFISALSAKHSILQLFCVLARRCA